MANLSDRVAGQLDGRFINGVETDSIKVDTASGSQSFQNSSGTEVGSYDDSGAWEFGPSTKFSGVGSGSLSNGFFFNGPMRLDCTSFAQIRTAPAGGTLEFIHEGSGAGAGFAWYSGNRATPLGSADGTGSWSIGGSSFTGTHLLNCRRVKVKGSIVRAGLDISATIANNTSVTTTIPLATDQGGGLLVINGYVNATGAAFAWIGVVAIQVLGGSGTASATAISSVGVGTGSITVGNTGAGGFLTITNTTGTTITIASCTLVGG